MKRQKKILIAEDDPSFYNILKERFEEEDFLVLLAQDGKEFVSTALREKPDMLLVDVLLPLQNGIEAVKKIREKSPDVPVIFLTNVKDSDYASSMKECKGGECMIKSDVHIEEVVDKVKEKLGIKS